MSTMAQNENEIDISPMLKDINKVLKGHLSSILGPIINEKNAIQSILLNMPYVKRLKAENEVLRRHVFQLKTELETNKTFYEKQLENASTKNVKLEVRDRLSNLNETPSKIVELKQQMWRKNEKVNSQDDEDEDDDEEDDMYDQEDDDYDDDDDDDGEDYESPILANLRMSLTIDKKADEVVEITSAGTIETSEDDEKIKNVTVWNLNSTEEEKVESKKEEMEEVEEEEEEEEEEVEEEDDGDEEDHEDDDDDDEEDEDDEEEVEEDEEDVEDDEEEVEEEEVEEEEAEEKEENEGHVNPEDEDEDEEELDVEDVEIDGVQYLTTSTENGEIYKCDDDGEIMEDEHGDFIICGYFKNGIANFI